MNNSLVLDVKFDGKKLPQYLANVNPNIIDMLIYIIDGYDLLPNKK